MPSLPTGLVGGESGVVSWFNALNKRYNAGAIYVEDQSGWDPNAANNDAAFADALVLAKAGAGGRTVLLPELLKLATNHNTEGAHVKGRGSLQDGGGSTVQLTAAAGGLKIGDLSGTQRGGSFEDFFVDAQDLATVPLSAGVVVRPSIARVALKNSAGTGLLLQGTQNALVQLFSALYCTTDALQLDRCGGCVIDKSEFGASGRYNGNLMSGGAALPFGVDYPLQNTIRDSLFEFHNASTVAMFHQGAGIDNALERCQFTTSTTPTTAALKLIILEQAGAPYSTDLRLRDATLVHNFVSDSTIGIDIVGAQSRFLGYGYHKIVGSNIGIRRLDNTGGAVSYFGNVIVAGVTTNKVTGAGTAGWVDATFM